MIANPPGRLTEERTYPALLKTAWKLRFQTFWLTAIDNNYVHNSLYFKLINF